MGLDHHRDLGRGFACALQGVRALGQRHEALEALRTSATWRTLSSQPNWDLWFAQQQQYLHGELQRFEAVLQTPAASAPDAMTHA